MVAGQSAGQTILLPQKFKLLTFTLPATKCLDLFQNFQLWGDCFSHLLRGISRSPFVVGQQVHLWVWGRLPHSYPLVERLLQDSTEVGRLRQGSPEVGRLLQSSLKVERLPQGSLRVGRLLQRSAEVGRLLQGSPEVGRLAQCSPEVGKALTRLTWCG